MFFCCLLCESLRISRVYADDDDELHCSWNRAYAGLKVSHPDVMGRFETMMKEDLRLQDTEKHINDWDLKERYVEKRMPEDLTAFFDEDMPKLFPVGGLKELLAWKKRDDGHDEEPGGPPRAAVSLSMTLLLDPSIRKHGKGDFKFERVFGYIDSYLASSPDLITICRRGTSTSTVRQRLDDAIFYFAREVQLWQIQAVLLARDRLSVGVLEETPTDAAFEWPSINLLGKCQTNMAWHINNCYQAWEGGHDFLPAAQDSLRELTVAQGQRRNGVDGFRLPVSRWILYHEPCERWCEYKQEDIRVLWITGDVGKGKTMLLNTISQDLRATMPHILKFDLFCSASTSRSRSSGAGPLLQLINSMASLRWCSPVPLQEGLKYGKDIFQTKSGRFAARRVLRAWLSYMDGATVCIDALDECGDELDDLFDLILAPNPNSRTRWAVTSRSNCPRVDVKLSQAPKLAHIVLEDLDDELVEAIGLYIVNQLEKLTTTWENPLDTLQTETITKLLSARAGGTILWASLALRQLRHVRSANELMDMVEAMPSGIDSLYRLALNSIRQSSQSDRLERAILVCLIAFQPLTVNEMVSVLPPAPEEVETLQQTIERHGHALLTITSELRTVEFVHCSAREFLSSNLGLDDLKHLADAHSGLVKSLLITLKKSLGRDMWGLQHPGASKNDRQPAASDDPLIRAGYACQFWSKHIESIPPNTLGSEDLEPLEESITTFLTSHFLHWLEAMSLLDALIEAGFALERLHQFAKTHEMAKLADIAWDCYRFYRNFKVAIDEAPLQVYTSAALFTPLESLVRGLVQRQLSEDDEVASITGRNSKWQPYTQRLNNQHRKGAKFVYSPDGLQVYYVCSDHIEVRDAGTGVCLHAIDIHLDEKAHFKQGMRINTLSSDCRLLAQTSSVSDVSLRLFDIVEERWSDLGTPPQTFLIEVLFSKDAKRLATMSLSGVVEVWNLKTRRLTVKMDRDSEGWMKFLGHGTDFAHGTPESDILIYNTDTGNCICEIGHKSTTLIASFPRDTTKLLTVSEFHSVSIWDVPTQETLKTYEAPEDISYRSKDVSVAENENVIAFLSSEKHLHVWKLSKDEWFQPSETQFERILFSPDSRILLTTTKEDFGLMSQIWLWDVASLSVCIRYEVSTWSHTFITSLAFSPDSTQLISSQGSAQGGNIKVWPLRGIGHGEETAVWPSPRSNPEERTTNIYHAMHVAFSPDGKWLAVVARGRRNLDLWTASTGVFERNLLRLEEEDAIAGIEFSWDSIHIAVGTDRGAVHLVSVLPDVSPRKYRGLSPATAFAFSRDNNRWYAACNSTIHVQNLNEREGHADSSDDYTGDGSIFFINAFPTPSHLARDVALALNADLIAYASSLYGLRVLDRKTEETIKVFLDTDHRRVIALDMRRWEGALQLISGSSDGLLRITDFETGKIVQTIKTPGIHRLSLFSGSNTLLDTNLGQIDLAEYDAGGQMSHVKASKVSYRGYGLSSSMDWITKDGKRHIWLPEEYRGEAGHFAVNGSRVAVGCKTGSLLVLNMHK